MIEIYEVTREWVMHMFLCEPHAETRRADGQIVKAKPRSTLGPIVMPWPLPQEFGCDDCPRAA